MACGRLLPGDRVRMSEALRAQLRAAGSGAHVDELGECVGVVQGPTDWNGVAPGDPAWRAELLGPEVDVRWQPSNLRYCYDPSELELA